MRTREEAGHTDEPDTDLTPDILPEPTLTELLQEIQRAPHDGRFEPKLERHEFTHTQIVAWVNDMKINRKGDVVITFTVPYRYRHFAYPLGDAQGLPLSMDIVRWQRFEQYRESLAGDSEGD
jgi:hypothetical protein